MWVSEVYRRNDKSPYKGITALYLIPISYQISVEMIKVRIRALLQFRRESIHRDTL